MSFDDKGTVNGFARVGALEPKRALGSNAPASGDALSNGGAPVLSPRERWQQFISRIPECEGDLRMREECQYVPPEPGDPAPATPAKPSRAITQAVAREVVVTLQLPEAAPHIGPDPNANEWDMAVVGYPLWLWTEGPRTLSATEAAHGITFTLQATHVDTMFTMGDGNSITCTKTQPYPVGIEPGTPSPTCGYTYQKASRPTGEYTVTATSRWQVTWSALGYTGVLPAQMTGTRQLPVGELQSVVIR